MIFPDLPKRPQFWTNTQINTVNAWAEQAMTKMQPASQADPKSNKPMTIEQWWVAHGISPVLGPGARHSGPIDWFARDAWEFYFLCAFMIAWVGYWYWYPH